MIYYLRRKEQVPFDDIQSIVVRAADEAAARALVQTAHPDDHEWIRDPATIPRLPLYPWGPTRPAEARFTKGRPVWTTPELSDCTLVEPEGPDAVICVDYIEP